MRVNRCLFRAHSEKSHKIIVRVTSMKAGIQLFEYGYLRSGVIQPLNSLLRPWVKTNEMLATWQRTV